LAEKVEVPGEDLLLSHRTKGRVRTARRRQTSGSARARRTVSSSTSGTPALLTHCATASSSTFSCVLNLVTNAAGPCLVMSLYACVASWIEHLTRPCSSSSSDLPSLASRSATRSSVRRATSSALRASPEMPATDLAIFCSATSSKSGVDFDLAVDGSTSARRASRIRLSSVQV
jgi:hypothetical protein